MVLVIVDMVWRIVFQHCLSGRSVLAVLFVGRGAERPMSRSGARQGLRPVSRAVKGRRSTARRTTSSPGSGLGVTGETHGDRLLAPCFALDQDRKIPPRLAGRSGSRSRRADICPLHNTEHVDERRGGDPTSPYWRRGEMGGPHREKPRAWAGEMIGGQRGVIARVWSDGDGSLSRHARL
jgi:hypothetical protein